MRSASSQTLINSLCCLAGVLAIAACTGRDSTPSNPKNSSPTVSNGKCEEWERADASVQGLGWDLVYEPVLKNNGFGPDTPMWKWIHTDGPRPPVNKMAAEWQDEPISSSILIEVVGPEGSPGGFWFVRTKNHLYRWDFNKGKFDSQKEELANLKEYDEAFQSIACWQQAAPVKTDTLFEGYYGFLSLYKEGRSRQMLLTFRDFFLVDPREDTKDLKDSNTWGRLWKTLAPVLESLQH